MYKSLCFLSLLLITLISTSLQINLLPWEVNTAMANREIRYHHYIWHNIRNNWNTLNASTQAQIRELGWAPPRPAQDAHGNGIADNNSGEDFLNFHREMIASVNRLLNKLGRSNVAGFTTIPLANDPYYTLPPIYNGPTTGLTRLIRYYKSNTYYNYIKNQEKKLTDPTVLKSMTLGELGSYIEFGSDVHQGLHFRFSEYNHMMRPKSSPIIPFIDPKWDVNTSNWMGDIYSSQVNVWFWKVHGWIDDRINDWQKAHNLEKIEWTGTWTGGNMANLPKADKVSYDPDDRFLGKAEKTEDMVMDKENDMEGMGAMNMTNLEAVGKILMESGISCDYFTDFGKVNIPEHFTDDGDEEDGSCSLHKKK